MARRASPGLREKQRRRERGWQRSETKYYCSAMEEEGREGGAEEGARGRRPGCEGCEQSGERKGTEQATLARTRSCQVASAAEPESRGRDSPRSLARRLALVSTPRPSLASPAARTTTTGLSSFPLDALGWSVSPSPPPRQPLRLAQPVRPAKHSTLLLNRQCARPPSSPPGSSSPPL